jgi:hypothetical protein
LEDLLPSLSIQPDVPRPTGSDRFAKGSEEEPIFGAV